MYSFMQKYKWVIINAAILTSLILASMDYHKDFFLGAASGVVLVNFGESIGNLRKKKENALTEENISVINE